MSPLSVCLRGAHGIQGVRMKYKGCAWNKGRGAQWSHCQVEEEENPRAEEDGEQKQQLEEKQQQQQQQQQQEEEEDVICIVYDIDVVISIAK